MDRLRLWSLCVVVITFIFFEPVKADVLPSGQIIDKYRLVKPGSQKCVVIAEDIRKDGYFDKDTSRLSEMLRDHLIINGWRIATNKQPASARIIIGTESTHRRYKEKSDLGVRIIRLNIKDNYFISYRSGWMNKVMKKINE